MGIESRFLHLTAIAVLSISGAAAAEDTSRAEDVAPAATLREGDVIRADALLRIRAYLPPELWEHREFYFYEGMEMVIGPAHREYAPSSVYRSATERFRGESRLGPSGALEEYTAGEPFPDVDCASDPDAGTKIAWNFDKRWRGGGGRATFSYTYWDRGIQQSLHFHGSVQGEHLAHRVESQYLDDSKLRGDRFKNETRKGGSLLEVSEPFDARGITILGYRYKSSDRPKDEAQPDDTWLYVPSLRRTLRFTTHERTQPVAGTDFTVDDLNSFAGMVPQYRWSCKGEGTYLAPMNTIHEGFPFSDGYNYGPYGLSYANDRWELRRAWVLEFVPRDPDHPYSSKTIYIDRESMEPLYSFAYDRRKEMWKIILHNHLWSEDHAKRHEPWEGVEEGDVKDLVVVSESILNVQTGTGNRIDFWDISSRPMKNSKRVRQLLDVGRLTRGR
jgi:hypothetical protein